MAPRSTNKPPWSPYGVQSTVHMCTQKFNFKTSVTEFYAKKCKKS